MLLKVFHVELALNNGIDDSIPFFLPLIPLSDTTLVSPINHRCQAHSTATQHRHNHGWPESQHQDAHPIDKVKEVPSFEAHRRVAILPDSLRPEEKDRGANRAEDEGEDCCYYLAFPYEV